MALLVAVAALGCTRPATQLVVIVDTDFVDPDPLTAVEVAVETTDGMPRTLQRYELTGGGRFALPLSLGVVPEGGDHRRRVRVVARGLGADGAERVTRSARTGFVSGAALALPLFLPRACADLRCPRGTTCVAGPPITCVSDEVDPGSLGVVPPAVLAARDGGELRLDAALPLDGATADALASSDVARPDAADAMAPPDGGVCELADDFNSVTPPPIWSAFVNANVGLARAGGALVITPPSGGTLMGYGGYNTRSPIDLRGGSASIEVAQPAAMGTSAETAFIVLDGTWQAQFVLGGALLLRVIDVARARPPDDVRVTYDPVRDRWWRFRVTGADLVWETSPDGAAWTERRRARPAIDYARAGVTITAGTWQPVADPGQARFDNFRAVYACR